MKVKLFMENMWEFSLCFNFVPYKVNIPMYAGEFFYTKLADRVDADSAPKNMVRKTAAKKRAASPEAGSSNSSSHGSSSSRNVRGRGGLDAGRRDSGGYHYNPGTHPNQRGGWLPSFTRGGNRGGSGRGRGRSRNYF